MVTDVIPLGQTAALDARLYSAGVAAAVYSLAAREPCHGGVAVTSRRSGPGAGMLLLEMKDADQGIRDGLSAALACAEQGWRVLPLCWPNPMGKCGCGRRHPSKKVGKAPLTEHGVKDATTDADTIRTWWVRWAKANVGIALETAGLLVIDVDSPEAMAEAQKLGLLPTVIRTSRYPAFIYRRPPNCPAVSKCRWGASGKIDILANNYLVAFGTHRTGCKVSLDDWDGKVEPAPEWAVSVLTEVGERRTPGKAELPDDLPEVNLAEIYLPATLRYLITECSGHPDRSKRVFRVGTWLVKLGYTDEEIASILLDPRYPISEKPRQQGQPWVAEEIGRAREKARISKPEAEELVALVQEWRDMQNWGGVAGATDLAVLGALLQFVVQTGKTEVYASIRGLADMAQVTKNTAQASIHRLQERGVLVRVQPGGGRLATTWTLRVPLTTPYIHSYNFTCNGSTDKGAESPYTTPLCLQCTLPGHSA